jgi:hypothetical protein
MTKCCGLDSIWVENVPGKGYNYCTECKQEVSPFNTQSAEEIEAALIKALEYL